MRNLTKKQQKASARLIIGCIAMYSDFGLDEAKTTDDDITNVSNEIQLLAYKLIGKDESFPTTAEIIEYVRNNY